MRAQDGPDSGRNQLEASGCQIESFAIAVDSDNGRMLDTDTSKVRTLETESGKCFSAASGRMSGSTMMLARASKARGRVSGAMMLAKARHTSVSSWGWSQRCSFCSEQKPTTADPEHSPTLGNLIPVRYMLKTLRRCLAIRRFTLFAGAFFLLAYRHHILVDAFYGQETYKQV